MTVCLVQILDETSAAVAALEAQQWRASTERSLEYARSLAAKAAVTLQVREEGQAGLVLHGCNGLNVSMMLQRLLQAPCQPRQQLLLIILRHSVCLPACCQPKVPGCLSWLLAMLLTCR